MQSPPKFLAFLIGVVKALLLGWIKAFPQLCARVRALIDRKCRGRDLPGRLKKASPNHCVPLSDPAYKRPDPLIYDQYYLMAQGIAVTWDNPDIQLWQRDEGGQWMPVDSHGLQPNTEYQVVARIWNGSTEAPIVGLPVTFDYLNFGVGTLVNPIGATTVNLGVKGGPGAPAFASVLWRTPQDPGHYCLQAGFAWADDVNPGNNLGQENTDVLEAHSPAVGTFALRNQEKEPDVFAFTVDAYRPPAPRPCGEHPPRRDPGRYRGRVAPGTVEEVPEGHDVADYPLPDGWSVSFDPVHPALDPGEQVQVQITVTPPDGFVGRQAVNVHARGRRGGLAGGVTFYVEAA